MARNVYGYAWKDEAKRVQKKFVYADSQAEADKEFQELTKLDPTVANSGITQSRNPA